MNHRRVEHMIEALLPATWPDRPAIVEWAAQAPDPAAAAGPGFC